MPLLDDIRRQLTDLFRRGLQDTVTLHCFTRKTSVLTIPSLECHTCQEAGELLKEVRHPPQSGWLDEWGRLKGGHPLVQSSRRGAPW